MNEKELQDKVLELCRKYNLLVFHSTDSRRDIGKGWPDLTIAGKNLLFAELKSDVGRLSPEQTTWRYTLQSIGFGHVVWRPIDLQDGTIEHQLKELT